MSEKNENAGNAFAGGTLKAKSRGPKKCPSCGSNDILEADGGAWYYCNNCMAHMDKDGHITRPGYWS